jgi:plasmid stabilization system protein ParE
MRIRYAASAKQDLSDIQDYIAQDDQAAAYRLAQRVKSQISGSPSTHTSAAQVAMTGPALGG